MAERKSRSSRFRRSRFRTPKEPEEAVEEQESEDIPGFDDESEPSEEQEAPGGGGSVSTETPQKPVLSAIQVANVLTIDVKEWFQTAACRGIVKFYHWGKYERRVERGIQMILALLNHYEVKATFFVLGIVAREFPEIIRMIANQGHEIGAMGYYNRMLHTITPREYIKEMEMSLSILKSIIKKDVVLHRAPEWSVTERTLWFFDILKSFGIKYDSSIYPVGAPLYGIECSPRFPYKIDPQGIIEFPPTTLNFAGKNIALFGGTYMRVLPYKLVSMGFNSINRQGYPVMVHLSPWEIEADFPKIDLGWKGFMNQYAGIKSTFSRLNKMLNQFSFQPLTKVIELSPPSETILLSNISRSRRLLF